MRLFENFDSLVGLLTAPVTNCVLRASFIVAAINGAFD